MKRNVSRRLSSLLFLPVLAYAGVAQGPSAQPSRRETPNICSACIRAHMEFLASDALRGRGSGTADELVAATYIAAELQAYGVEPAGDNGGFLQRSSLLIRKFAEAPTLTFIAPGDGKQIVFTNGKDFVVSELTREQFSGPLQKIDIDKKDLQIKEGSVVLITSKDKHEARQTAFVAAAQGATGVILAGPEEPKQFETAVRDLPRLKPQLEDQAGGEPGNVNVLELSADALKVLQDVPEGTGLHFEGSSTTEKGHTWNVVGKLRGSDPKLRNSAVILSAHLDHLGIGQPVNGDNIYNGADDDASGVAAVLEFARVLSAGPRPRRTVIFALFGSEETGALGSAYFGEHPPLPLEKIAADLEIEMIGRPDSVVSDDNLWLTGWDRSNLGPALAAHGAHLVPDPRPEQNFFARSDNFGLAKKGVVAHTISSFGLHSDYHEPSDDLAHIDFKHLNAAIRSLLGPVEWLANSGFKPQWREGGQP
jgi:aminopeptidase YwaD